MGPGSTWGGILAIIIWDGTVCGLTPGHRSRQKPYQAIQVAPARLNATGLSCRCIILWKLRMDHQLVIRLTRGSVAKYAVCFQCRPEVEKAVYHSSRAWAVSVTPLQNEDNLNNEQITALETSLGAIH